ncbi:MAG: HlyD family efflux transporter periplasmic adaptor subunit [bacterium]|nr:HlyD family efflux transporter periplasmic adaptor subunit [bacterium]
MKKFLRRLLFILVIIAIGIGGFRLYQNNQVESQAESQPLVVDRVTIDAGDLTVTVSATGSITPIRQVPLLFELVAPIRDILVTEGQVVTAGDILATLETTDYEATLFDAQVALDLQQVAFDSLTSPVREEDIAVAQAAVDVAQASVNAAYSTSLSQNQTAEEIARLQVELAGNQLWQAQLQRDATLTASTIPLLDFNNLPPEIVDNVPPDILDEVVTNINNLLGGISPSVNPSQFDVQLNQLGGSVEIAESNYNAAQSRNLDSSALSASELALIQAQQTLDRLVNGAKPEDIEIAEIDLQRARLAFNQAELLLKRTQLRAPFDGVVAQNNLTVGELPPNQLPAMILMDVSNFVVDLPVDETDVVTVQVGQRVEFTLDALPDAQITGVVERVSLTPTKIGTLVTYVVRVRLDPTTEPIKVGMSVTARIATQELSNVVLVPNRYIRIDRATQQAYVTIERAQGQFEEILIEIGARNDRFTQVTSGVSVGDVVVLLPRGE